MTTNKTTNKNTNTATMIDENRFFKCVAPFLFSHSQVIPEMIENAIRAKSSSVKIQTKDLNNQVQNIKEIIPKVQDNIVELLLKAKQKLQEEISITSRFLRFNTLFATFLGGFFVGALLLFFYHILLFLSFLL